MAQEMMTREKYRPIENGRTNGRGRNAKCDWLAQGIARNMIG
jgi:hypothetical protein